MRRYRQSEKDRWRQILGVLHWCLEMRLRDMQLRKERTGKFLSIDLELLRIAYEDSVFLHRFLGYEKKTKVEQRAEEILRENEPAAE